MSISTYIFNDELDKKTSLLERKSKYFINKPSLSEEQLEILDSRIKEYSINSIISLKYYQKGNIFHITGTIIKKDNLNKFILVDNKKIFYSNIIEIY